MGEVQKGQATLREIRKLKKTLMHRITKYDDARSLVKKMGLETYWPRRWYVDPESASFADCRTLQHFVWTERGLPISQVRQLIVNAMSAGGKDGAAFKTFFRKEFKSTTKIAWLLGVTTA
jgi:hypothetical protein